MSDGKEVKNPTNSVYAAHNYTYQCIQDIDFENPDVVQVKKLLSESDTHLETVLALRDRNHNLEQEASKECNEIKPHFYRRNLILYILSFASLFLFGIYILVASLISRGEKLGPLFTQNNHEAIILWAVSFGISAILVAIALHFDSKGSAIFECWRTAENKLNDSKQMVQQFFLLNTVERLLLDKTMYKSLYTKIFEVQEWMYENDPKGYKALEKAFEKTGTNLIDFLKEFQNMKDDVVNSENLN